MHEDCQASHLWTSVAYITSTVRPVLLATRSMRWFERCSRPFKAWNTLNSICFCAAKLNAVAQHSARVRARQLKTGEERADWNRVWPSCLAILTVH